MTSIRTLHWPEDSGALHALDGSFTTDRIYRLDADGHAFALREMKIIPPLVKKFPLPGDVDALPTFDLVRIAVDSDSIIGFAAVKYEMWNRRAVLYHIYISSKFRGRGAGRLLTDSISDEAKARGSRCIWAETQTTNYNAVKFYERIGFTLCGFDTSLYDPSITPGEIALFYKRDL